MKILLATSRVARKGTGVPTYNYELQQCLCDNCELYLLVDAYEHDVDGYVKTYSTFGHNVNDYDYCHRLVNRINEAGYDCIINSASSFIPAIAPFIKSAIVSVSHFVDGKLAIKAGYNAQYQSGIVALSEYGRDFLIQKFRIKDTAMVRSIYNAVAAPISLNEAKIHQSPLKIVYPGGTSVQKSVDVVQRLVYRLLRSNLDFEFYWLGATTLPSAKLSCLGLKDTRQLFRSDKRLKIMGFVPREEAMKIFAEANVFLLPSRGEGCPMTLLEAMREGCISIVSDAHHGSREIIEQSQSGFITRQGNSKDIFEAIVEIIAHRSEYDGYYTRGQEYVTRELSHSKWTKEMLALIDESIRRPKSTIPMTPAAFRTSWRGLRNLLRIERAKEMARSLRYRLRLDFAYFKSKLGLY